MINCVFIKTYKIPKIDTPLYQSLNQLYFWSGQLAARCRSHGVFLNLDPLPTLEFKPLVFLPPINGSFSKYCVAAVGPWWRVLRFQSPPWRTWVALLYKVKILTLGGVIHTEWFITLHIAPLQICSLDFCSISKNISGALCCVQNTSLFMGETQDQGRNDDSVSITHCQYLGQTVFILLMMAKIELASF